MPRSNLYRRMTGRDASELHRTATALELFFDLCFVVAVAFAAAELHHEIVDGHAGHAVVRFAMVFFAIWWAWLNFTWFASAYDTDDIAYRIATFVQMTGVLILAAGIPRIYAETDFTIAVLGYVVMRLALVPQWLRAGHGDPGHRTTTRRYALGIVLVQAGWVSTLFAPEDWRVPLFVVFSIAELAVPAWAESAAPTTWNHHHIAERHSLFTLIVLGETVLASTLAIQSALDAGFDELDLALLAAAGLVIVFSMWWLYFDQPPSAPDHSSVRSFAWGYGHLPLFAAIAALGAGLGVAIDRETGANVSDQTAALAVAVPFTAYLLTLCGIRSLVRIPGPTSQIALLLGALTALGVATAGLPVHLLAVIALLVAVAVTLDNEDVS